MCEEERQRQMDFILNSLAQLTVKLDGLTGNVNGLADIQRADAVRIGRIEDAFVTLTQLSERVIDPLDEHNTRLTTVEDAIVTLTGLVAQRDGAA